MNPPPTSPSGRERVGLGGGLGLAGGGITSPLRSGGGGGLGGGSLGMHGNQTINTPPGQQQPLLYSLENERLYNEYKTKAIGSILRNTQSTKTQIQATQSGQPVNVNAVEAFWKQRLSEIDGVWDMLQSSQTESAKETLADENKDLLEEVKGMQKEFHHKASSKRIEVNEIFQQLDKCQEMGEALQRKISDLPLVRSDRSNQSSYNYKQKLDGEYEIVISDIVKELEIRRDRYEEIIDTILQQLLPRDPYAPLYYDAAMTGMMVPSSEVYNPSYNHVYNHLPAKSNTYDSGDEMILYEASPYSSIDPTGGKGGPLTLEQIQLLQNEHSLEENLAEIIKNQNDRVMKLASFVTRWEKEFEVQLNEPYRKARAEIQQEEKVKKEFVKQHGGGFP